MKPKMMTSFGWPDGNCFAACMASIFEVEMTDLPNEGAGIYPLQFGEAVDAWTAPWQEWLNERGIQLVACDAWMPEVDGVQQMHKQPGYSILSCAVLGAPTCADGTEMRHAVVALDGRVVHNPEPCQSEEQGFGMHALWPREYQYFVVLDPTRLRLA